MNPQSWNGYAYVMNNPLTLVDPNGTDPFGGGGGDDPCDGDPSCGWGGWYGGFPFDWGSGPALPPPPPPPPQSLPAANQGGIYAQGQWGSWPNDGEALGLPMGMGVPGPLSWQALLGLWDWDCAAGICVPGLGIAEARPEWLNSVTSVFGYDQNVPLESCFVDVFLKSAVNNLNPFQPGWGDLTAGGFQAVSAIKYNQALKYAATTASRTFGTPYLLYPFKSSSFRGILATSQKLGRAAGWAGLDVSLGQALYNEIQAMRKGECQ